MNIQSFIIFLFVIVVGMQELQDRVKKAKDSNEKLMEVGREIVNFHGEMVLLENYSALNYTGELTKNGALKFGFPLLSSIEFQ